MGRASGLAGAMGSMLVLLGIAFWFGASAATVANWSANLLLSVTFLSADQRREQGLDVLDLCHLRCAGHRLRLALRARDQRPPAGPHWHLLDPGPALAQLLGRIDRRVRRSLALPGQGLAADGGEDLSGVVTGQPSAGEEDIRRGDLVRVGGPPHGHLLAE